MEKNWEHGIKAYFKISVTKDKETKEIRKIAMERDQIKPT